MEAPSVTPRQKAPFLLPVWLTGAAVIALMALMLVAFMMYRSATTTVVVLARHAERELGTIQDPPLTPEGEQRAERLAQMFGRARVIGHLDAIYVSDARRTQQTAAPLAERLGERVTIIPAADIKGTAARVMREHEGGTVLIVGHSNTVPKLIQALGGIQIEPIPDGEFDTLYVLSIPRFGHANLLRIQY